LALPQPELPAFAGVRFEQKAAAQVPAVLIEAVLKVVPERPAERVALQVVPLMVEQAPVAEPIAAAVQQVEVVLAVSVLAEEQAQPAVEFAELVA
jgi:hypothetical protein